MRRRRILDVAADHPEAPVEDIAATVRCATADLVAGLFEDQGDPSAPEDQKEQDSRRRSRRDRE